MHVCAFCQHTGKKGAQYLLAVKGHETQRVHRPCGEKLLSALPDKVEAKLEPSPELRLQWRQERQQKEDATRVKSFWAEKLQGLKTPEASALYFNS
jgi:hypothetical protein